MNETQEKAIAKLRAQMDKQPEYSAVRQAGQQLIDICSREPAAAEILLPDLDNPEMDIVHAEAQIHAAADKIHRECKGKLTHVGFSGAAAEKILRKFYGLPPAPETPPGAVYVDMYPEAADASPISINPLDFL